MARIVTGALTTFNLSTHLDPQTLDLYGLRELFSTAAYGAFPAYTGSNSKITIDAAGNVGLSITPNAWDASFKAIQLGPVAGVYGNSNSAAINQNTYYNGTNNIYLTTAAANRIVLSPSGFSFFSAPSGAAGSNATFTQNFVIDSQGNALVTGAGGIGYGAGSGGTVTQATSKATAVTLNKASGQITMNAASLAGNTTVGFNFANSLIGAADIVLVQVSSGIADGSKYSVRVGNVSAGNVSIQLTNTSGGALAEAVVLSFAVIRVATA